QLGRALEETRVEIEDVSRERLAARRTPEEQRELAVRRRVLREIVVDHERVAAAVADVLADGAAREGSDVLERSRFRGARRDDGRVFHRAAVLEDLHDLRDRKVLLPDRDVDAADAGALLVQDRVDRDGGLAGLAVADDELALPAADRDHRVDGLEPRLDGLVHGLAVHHARRLALERTEVARDDRPLAVDRLADRVHHAAVHGVADRHGSEPARPAHRIPLLDRLGRAEKGAAHVVLFQIEDDAGHVPREEHELSGHRVVETPDAGDTVADLEHRPDALLREPGLVPLELLLENRTDFLWLECHALSPTVNPGLEEDPADAPELRRQGAVDDLVIQRDGRASQEGWVHFARQLNRSP